MTHSQALRHTDSMFFFQYKEKGDESGLHIIIFDELDAICKQRGSTGGGTGVGDSVVNQLLSKVKRNVHFDRTGWY